MAAETKSDVNDIAWEIIFDMINIGLISRDAKTEELDRAHKWILKRLKNL